MRMDLARSGSAYKDPKEKGERLRKTLGEKSLAYRMWHEGLEEAFGSLVGFSHKRWKLSYHH